MNKKRTLHTLFVVTISIFFTLALKYVAAQADVSPTYNSAYPPPPTSPPSYPPPGAGGSSAILLPTQPAMSEAAQRALEHIANRDGLPIESLTILDDHPTEYLSLGRNFQVVTLLYLILVSKERFTNCW